MAEQIVEIANAGIGTENDIEIFNQLTIRDWARMFKLGSRQFFPPKTTILRAGQINQSLYFLIDGEVRIEQQTDDAAKVLAQLPSGCVFGEMSFLDGDVVSADVITTSIVEVLKFDKADLNDLVRSDQSFGLHFFQSLALTLSRRLRNTNYLVGSSGSSSI
jgi:CRP/FNR family cyclic AMP-dependent transcriptional regulator